MARKQHLIEGLCKILVSQELITRKQATDWIAAFAQGRVEAVTDVLLEEGLIEKSALLNALSIYYQVPWFDVDGYFFDHALVHRFPKGVLLRNAIIPMLVDDENILIMIAAEPDNQELLPIIGRYVSYDIRFLLGIARDIDDAVKEFYDEALTQVTQDDEPI